MEEKVNPNQYFNVIIDEVKSINIWNPKDIISDYVTFKDYSFCLLYAQLKMLNIFSFTVS